MYRFSKRTARWAVAFCWLVLILLLSFCATVPSSQKYVGSISNLKNSRQMDESFQTLWEGRTVYFGQARKGGNSLQMGIPFVTTGGPGGDSEFPLHITATLMDSLLIEAGLKHYASLIKMTPEEEAEFCSAYYQRYDPANHLLIWCELQTNWTELHLDLDRWIIFIEDDAGNQFEPVQILEESQPARPTAMNSMSGFQPGPKRQIWEINQKILMLCFPKFDFYQNPILSNMLQSLKLVFQLSNDPQTKAEGIWVFND
jgi:hypothetical protein